MICTFVNLLTGWCGMRMRPARVVSYAFLYTTNVIEIKVSQKTQVQNRLSFSAAQSFAQLQYLVASQLTRH